LAGKVLCADSPNLILLTHHPDQLHLIKRHI